MARKFLRAKCFAMQPLRNPQLCSSNFNSLAAGDNLLTSPAPWSPFCCLNKNMTVLPQQEEEESNRFAYVLWTLLVTR